MITFNIGDLIGLRLKSGTVRSHINSFGIIVSMKQCRFRGGREYIEHGVIWAHIAGNIRPYIGLYSWSEKPSYILKIKGARGCV